MDEKQITLTQEQKIEIGRKIHQCRIAKHYSLEELASQVNMSVQALERMENGDFEMFDDVSDSPLFSQSDFLSNFITHLKQ